MTKRLLSFLLTLVTCVVWLVPSFSPGGGVANAQTLANGFVLSGDFKGAGYSQIASLYDSGDNLGLRISVLDRAGATDQFGEDGPPGQLSRVAWATQAGVALLDGTPQIGRLSSSLTVCSWPATSRTATL